MSKKSKEQWVVAHLTSDDVFMWSEWYTSKTEVLEAIEEFVLEAYTNKAVWVSVVDSTAMGHREITLREDTAGVFKAVKLNGTPGNDQ